MKNRDKYIFVVLSVLLAFLFWTSLQEQKEKKVSHFLGNSDSLTIYQINQLYECQNKDEIIQIYLESIELNKADLEQIVKFSNVKDIRLIDCKFDIIPESWQRLTSLNSLMICLHKFKKLPDNLYNLVNLEALYVEGDSLEEVSSKIANLKKLQVLRLGSSMFGGSKKLKTLPLEIYQLKNLVDLDISLCGIEEISEDIENLTLLETFFAQQNFIKEIPSSISNLTHLEILILNNNNITEIPLELCEIKNLKQLYISNNPINTFPTCLEQQTNLTIKK